MNQLLTKNSCKEIRTFNTHTHTKFFPQRGPTKQLPRAVKLCTPEFQPLSSLLPFFRLKKKTPSLPFFELCLSSLFLQFFLQSTGKGFKGHRKAGLGWPERKKWLSRVTGSLLIATFPTLVP